MSLIENRTWVAHCKRGFVTQCLDTLKINATEDITSTAKAEKEARSQGWTLHDGQGDATCPVCLKLWDGELVLDTKGSIKTTQDGGDVNTMTEEAAKAEAAARKREEVGVAKSPKAKADEALEKS